MGEEENRIENTLQWIEDASKLWGTMRLVDKEDRLSWDMIANLRWLADQPDRPARMPCGYLIGQFLIMVADRLENSISPDGTTIKHEDGNNG